MPVRAWLLETGLFYEGFNGMTWYWIQGSNAMGWDGMKNLFLRLQERGNEWTDGKRMGCLTTGVMDGRKWLKRRPLSVTFSISGYPHIVALVFLFSARS